MRIDLEDCQCPACKAPRLKYRDAAPIDPACVYRDALACADCGEAYDVVWGVPFLGVYEEEDVLSLIEIAANADNYRRRGEPTKAGDLSYSEWYELLDAVDSRPSPSLPHGPSILSRLRITASYFKREHIQVRSLGTVFSRREAR